MPKPSVSVSSRANEFSNEGFYVNDKKILMCRYCDKRLEYERKDTLIKHIASDTHKRGKNKITASLKRQLSVGESFMQGKKAKDDKEQFVVDTTEAFLSAGISVERLDHPKMREWLAKYVKGSGDLPCADRIRQHYIPIIGLKKVEELKEVLKNKKLFIMCDETTDKSGNCIFNILFRLLEATDNQTVYLAASAVLDKANGSTCTQSIVDTLSKYEVEYHNVLGIVTDSARYMTLCSSTLKGLVGDNLAHVQCWAHKVNLVGQIWQCSLDELNTTVAKTKAAFLNTRKRKHQYLDFLREKYDDPTKVRHFPMPVQTRWNTWFEAARYIHEYLDDILEFMDQLGEENNGVKFLKDISPQFLAITKVQAQFVADNCSRFVNLITFLEGNSYPTAHVLHSKLKVLQNMLELLTKEVFSAELTSLLQGMTAVKKAEAVNQLKTTAQKSLIKLNNLIAEDPSKSMFTAIGKIFDPRTLSNAIPSIESTTAELKKLSYVSAIDSATFYEGYVVLQGLIKEEMKRPECTHVDICKIICSLREEYTEFVKVSLEAIWYPTSNVDSERSISRYGIVVSDRRRRLKPENAEILTMVAFS